MRNVLIAAALALSVAGSAAAQTVDPKMQALGNDWQAAQNANAHVLTSINELLDSYNKRISDLTEQNKKLQADLDAEKAKDAPTK